MALANKRNGIDLMRRRLEASLLRIKETRRRWNISDTLACAVFHGLCTKRALAPGALGAIANLNYGKEAHMFVVVALVLGIVSGLRTMTSPAVTSWAARMGLLAASGTPMAFMGSKYTPIIFTLLAIGELINDKLQNTASRKVPPQFIARILSGCLVGATVGAAAGSITAGLRSGPSSARWAVRLPACT